MLDYHLFLSQFNLEWVLFSHIHLDILVFPRLKFQGPRIQINGLLIMLFEAVYCVSTNITFLINTVSVVVLFWSWFWTHTTFKDSQPLQSLRACFSGTSSLRTAIFLLMLSRMNSIIWRYGHLHVRWCFFVKRMMLFGSNITNLAQETLISVFSLTNKVYACRTDNDMRHLLE